MKPEEFNKYVSEIKIQLMMRHPFFSALILPLPFELKYDMPMKTAATDGVKVYYDPDFFKSLTLDERIFVTIHEVMHCVYGHVWRREGRDPMLWNIACDIVINQQISEENIGKAPSMIVMDAALYAKGDGSADQIYELLRKEMEKNGQGKSGRKAFDIMDESKTGSGEGGDKGDQEGQGQGGSAEIAKADWNAKVAQAATVARMQGAGSMSAGLERMINEILNPKVPWQQVLRDYVVKTRSLDRTWARPSRRFMAHNIYMPARDGEEAGVFVIAVDCSISIGPQQLAEFAAEMRSIKQDVRPTTVHVVYFDSRVCHVDEFDQQDDLTVAPHGGGGTMFSPVFRWIDANLTEEPQVCIFLTDLMCNDFGPTPDYPVIWATTHKGKAPFGSIVEMF